MTKSELAEHLAQIHKLSKSCSGALLDAVFDCLLQAMTRDEHIEIRGFGSFGVRHYGSRKGRNPRNGASVQVKAKRLPTFRVGKELRAKIASGLRTTRELPAVEPATPAAALDWTRAAKG